MGSLLY